MDQGVRTGECADCVHIDVCKHRQTHGKAEFQAEGIHQQELGPFDIIVRCRQFVQKIKNPR